MSGPEGIGKSGNIQKLYEAIEKGQVNVKVHSGLFRGGRVTMELDGNKYKFTTGAFMNLMRGLQTHSTNTEAMHGPASGFAAEWLSNAVKASSKGKTKRLLSTLDHVKSAIRSLPHLKEAITKSEKTEPKPRMDKDFSVLQNLGAVRQELEQLKNGLGGNQDVIYWKSQNQEVRDEWKGKWETAYKKLEKMSKEMNIAIPYDLQNAYDNAMGTFQRAQE